YSLLLTSIHSNVIEEVYEWLEMDSSIDGNHSLISPMEKADLIIEDLFVQYHELKPSTPKDVIEIKKSFMEFLQMTDDQRNEIFARLPTPHKALSQMLKVLIQIAKYEFEDLEEEEQEFLENVNTFVWHKLSAQAALKFLKKKRAEYKSLGMTQEQI
ncbi:hypothetical protein PENTCL1PPCAC_5721, partial [Pristionchus entomophagus]